MVDGLKIRFRDSGVRVRVPEGLEPSPDSPGKTHISDSGGAECGALEADRLPPDPADSDLTRLIDAWALLPDSTRSEILAVLDSAREGARK